MNNLKGRDHPSYKGDILATSLITGHKYILRGVLDIEDHGFANECVYACVNGRAKSHQSHTFERITK